MVPRAAGFALVLAMLAPAQSKWLFPRAVRGNHGCLYVAGTVAGFSPNTPGQIGLSNPTFLAFTSQSGMSILVRWKNIASVTYGEQAVHRKGLVLLATPWVRMTPQIRHLLTIRYRDDNGVAQVVMLEISKTAVPGDMLVIHARTGRAVSAQPVDTTTIAALTASRRRRTRKTKAIALPAAIPLTPATTPTPDVAITQVCVERLGTSDAAKAAQDWLIQELVARGKLSVLEKRCSAGEAKIEGLVTAVHPRQTPPTSVRLAARLVNPQGRVIWADTITSPPGNADPARAVALLAARAILAALKPGTA